MTSPTSQSMKLLLRDIIQKDRNILADRDTLIALLNEQVTGAMMGEFTSLKTALQKNIGERFLAADNASEEGWDAVCNDVRKQLIQSGMQDIRADSVVEIFSYALRGDGENSFDKAASASVKNDSLPAEIQEKTKTAEIWTCPCGSVNDGKFCVDCGKARPQSVQSIESSIYTANISMPDPKIKNSVTIGNLNTKLIAIAVSVFLLGGIAYFLTDSHKQSAMLPQVKQTAPQSVDSTKEQKTSVETTAPPQPSAPSIATRARMSFLMHATDGRPYEIYIVGENERMLGADWVWRQKDKHEEIWAGTYRAYLGQANGSQPDLQSVYLFKENSYQSTDTPRQRINLQYPNYDGFYVVKGNGGRPDILVCTIRETGGGSFTARLFVVKDGKLQLLRFMNEEQKLSENRTIGFDRLEYAADGTVAVPWWTNAKPHAGMYTTFYAINVNDLILQSVNTIKQERK